MTVTNSGLGEIANVTIGSGTAFSYLAIGTGVVAASVNDTALGTENDRGSATVSRDTVSVANDTSKFVKNFAFTGSVAVTEAGIFNDVSVGVLLARSVFDAINVVDGDSLEISYFVTFG